MTYIMQQLNPAHVVGKTIFLLPLKKILLQINKKLIISSKYTPMAFKLFSAWPDNIETVEGDSY